MEARKARHLKVLAQNGSFSLSAIARLPGVFSDLKFPRWETKEVIQTLTHPSFLFRKSSENTVSTSNTLFKRYTVFVGVLFVLSTITTQNGFVDASYYDAPAGSIISTNTVVMNEEGYLTKLNPQTTQGDRSTMNDHLIHTVAAGETLSTIAKEYDLKTATIMWENGITNANSLRTGQKLLIPPVDGVSHKVGKGESVEKIAKLYGVNSENIVKQNHLLASTVTTGQELFIPGAKPLPVAEPTVRANPARVASSARVNSVSGAIVTGSTDVPVGDKPFIFPTRGTVTRGFKSGHPAFDIGNRSKPPVWAAGAGKVVKASSGTWGGGYGNHVIIDHGNGLQTLYGHLDSLSVNEGDYVTQGQVIGIMGNTGRVYGPTGIHLHFEVRVNGKKQVPSHYY